MLPKTALTSNTRHKFRDLLATLTFEQLASNSKDPTPPSYLLEQFTEFRKVLHLTILVFLQQKDTNQNQPKGEMLKVSLEGSWWWNCHPQGCLSLLALLYLTICRIFPIRSSPEPLVSRVFIQVWSHTAYAANL